MSKKVLSLCLLSTMVVSAQLCALRTVSDLFSDPEIFNTKAFGIQEQDLELIKGVYLQMEAVYDQINEKFGNATTKKIEKEMDEEIKKYTRAGADGIIDKASLEKLGAHLTELVSHAQNNKNAPTEESARFALSVLSIRLVVAGAECAAENPEMQRAMHEGKDKNAIERKNNLAKASMALDEYVELFIQKKFGNIFGNPAS